MDLSFLGCTNIYAPLRIGSGLAVIMFAVGLVPLITLGYSSALLIMVGVLEIAQGAIRHHLQLTCLLAGAM